MAAVPATRPKGRLSRQETRTFYAFIAPWAIGFLAFTAGPILASLYFSFTDYNVTTPPLFVGLGNYSTLFRHDPIFFTALGNTIYYVAFSVPIDIIVAFALALLLNLRVRFLPLFRTLFYVPSIVPLVASVILWIWLLQPQWGLIDAILRLVGLPGPLWLADPAWAKPALVLMSAWSVGGLMIIFLAGLQGIPEHLFEAAAIDGAGRWSKFRHVTIPMMTPTIFFTLIVTIIAQFQVFVQPFIMTNGGPVDSTLMYALYLYQQAWNYLHMGIASAMAWILLVIVLALTLLQFRLANRWVYYEGAER